MDSSLEYKKLQQQKKSKWHKSDLYSSSTNLSIITLHKVLRSFLNLLHTHISTRFYFASSPNKKFDFYDVRDDENRFWDFSLYLSFEDLKDERSRGGLSVPDLGEKKKKFEDIGMKSSHKASLKYSHEKHKSFHNMNMNFWSLFFFVFRNFSVLNVPECLHFLSAFHWVWIQIFLQLFLLLAT